MNIETLRYYCLSKDSVTESFPFDNETLVFKVSGKIFALALELRERYSAVKPGYHMNKKHWNTISVDGSVPDREILSWIDNSYNLVRKKK